MKIRVLSIKEIHKVSIVSLILLQVSLVVVLILKNNSPSVVNRSYQCHTNLNLTLIDNISKSLSVDVRKNQITCFNFNAVSGKILILETNAKITLMTPSKDVIRLQGSEKRILQNSGIYSIILNTEQAVTTYKIVLKLEAKNVTTKPSMKIIEASYGKLQETKGILPLTYNVLAPPPFKQNQKLQETVNNIVNLVQSKGLPVNRFSVSLVDLSSSECCAYASYSDREPRFPASVTKLFWMVYLYGQYQAGVLPEGTVPAKKLSKMIQDSDNESASFIVDTITATEPGENLPPDAIENWLQKRYALNLFFEKSGYSTINISQKLFPTDYIKNDNPTGRELQIRGGDESNPIRNYITTYNVARLLFEIHTYQSISKKSSEKMKSLLRRDLHKVAWKDKPFNAIEGFLGESLPENAFFASKMGWNSNTRNDAAIIESSDGKYKYILVVFGDDPSFYKDKTIYPEISRIVYKQMTN